MRQLSNLFSIFKYDKDNRLRWFATIFIILFNIYYIPIEPNNGGLGIIKIPLMFIACIVLLTCCFQVNKATIIALAYCLWQYLSAIFHPETFRWSTLLFSFGLLLSYVSLYNLIHIKNVFTIRYFLRIVKWVMMAYFVLCIMQQVCLVVGISYLPILNLHKILNRGIGCNSWAIEPSTFARTMLVFYYAYIKCNEYIRGEGRFTLKDLFSGEHKWVTIRFIWMMTTMGSGTAYVCLILLSLYFINWRNCIFIIPLLAFSYYILDQSGIEQAERATAVLNATATMDKSQVYATDGSAASRISLLLNSLNADFSQKETWFGRGIDYGKIHNTFVKQTGTLFDEYGFIFYIISLILNFSCAYTFWSLGTIFLFAGIAGGSGSNINYAWALLIVMTCIRYFYEHRFDPEVMEYEDDRSEIKR